MGLAVYDLDKTLTRRATFTPFLLFATRVLAPWRLLFLPLWFCLILGHLAGLYDRTALKTTGMRLILGKVALHQLNEAGENFAAAHLADSGWNDDVVAMLREDEQRGLTIVIATAAFRFYAKAFARRLGVEHVIATGWNGRAIVGENCYGHVKRQRVLDWAEGRVINRMVSDSFADTPLLELAEHPVFVTNSHKKRARALDRDWHVVMPAV